MPLRVVYLLVNIDFFVVVKIVVFSAGGAFVTTPKHFASHSSLDLYKLSI